MKKSKNLFILIICLGLLFVSSISATFAYFAIKNNKDYETSVDINNEIALEVSSFDELYNASINPIFNDSNNISNARKVIKFNSDIVLENNVEIKNDVHINLNNKKLYLNGYDLTISHGYVGTFDIENGTIYPFDTKETPTSGVININTPNAVILTSNLVFKDNEENNISQSSETFIKVEQIDFDYISYNAFYFVNNLLKNDIERYNDKLSYNEIKKLTTYDSSVFKDASLNSLSNKNESYYYLSKDIELTSFYLSKNIELSYSFNNATSISNTGKLIVPSTYERVVMNVKVSLAKLNKEKNMDFILYVINPSNNSIKNTMALDIIKSYLNPFYHNESVVIGPGKQHDTYYLLDTALELPKKSLDFGINYSYAPYKDKECTVPVFTESVDSEYTYLFEPNQDCLYLKMNYGNNASTVLNTYSTFISSFESACRSIVNTLYGGSFVYDSSSNSHKIYSWNEIRLDKRFEELINVFDITNVTYSFKPNSEAYSDYAISGSGDNLSLTLASEKPQLNKEEALRITFTLGERTQNIDLYIIYVSSGGETINTFLTYYSIFAKQVPLQETLESFELPLSYNDGTPYVAYDFASSFDEDLVDGVTYYNNVILDKDASLIVQLVDKDGNVLQTFTYTRGKSIVEEFDNYLRDNNYLTNGVPDVNEFIKANPQAKWKISFDKSKISFDNMKVLLIYNYKFSGTGEWTQFNKVDETNENVRKLTDATTSIFEINGGLFYGSSSTKENAIRDSKLFVYLYNKLNPNGVTLSESDNLSDYAILNSWILLIDKFDVSDAGLENVTSWNGIQYFSKCRELNFSNVNVTNAQINIDGRNYTVMDLISQLNSLVELSLNNSSITYDYNADYRNNNALSNIIKLSSSLETLYITGNNLSKFDWISSLSQIKKVYIYTNTSSNSNVSEYYGSLGICNFQTYEDLIRKGIAVYYDINSNGVPVLYEESTDLNDYTKLKGIVYQTSLKDGVSIVSLYEKYKSIDVGTSGFNLSHSGTLTWNHEGDATTSTCFYVTFTFTSGGNNITLVVKYYVDRY